MSKKIRKFRLLFDVAFARKEHFLKLSNKAHLAHSVFDFQLHYQATDEEIYKLATKNDYFVVTLNKRHFKKLLRKNCPGAIVVSPYSTNDQIEKSLIELIANKNPDDFYGKILE